jgi:hypothetical protein
MAVSQSGNSVVPNDSVDTGRRGFIRFLSTAGVATILTTTTGCANLLEAKPSEWSLKEIVLKKEVIFSGIREPMSPAINIKCNDAVSDECLLIHPRLKLLTVDPITVSPTWVFLEQEITLNGNIIFIKIAEQKYWPMEYNDKIRLWESNGILYIENITAKDRKAT